MKTNFHKYCYTIESNNGSTIFVRFSNNKELLKISKHEKLIHDVIWYIKDGSLSLTVDLSRGHYCPLPFCMDLFLFPFN